MTRALDGRPLLEQFAALDEDLQAMLFRVVDRLRELPADDLERFIVWVARMRRNAAGPAVPYVDLFDAVRSVAVAHQLTQKR